MKKYSALSLVLVTVLLLLTTACSSSNPTELGSNKTSAAVTTGRTPVIASFAPSWQLVGYPITIYGLNFDAIAANNTVMFTGASTPAIVASATATSLMVIVPQGATVGPVSVSSTTAEGTAVTTTSFVVRSFTDASAPKISSFSPNFGIVGTSVIIAGTNFYTSPEHNIVTFNGTQAVVTDANATSLTVKVPDGANGNVTVTTPGGKTAISPNSFTITSPEGVNPVIKSFTPLRGAAGVTQVVIRGKNFDTTAANNIVKFNGTEAPAEVVADAVSATSLMVTVPFGATSGPITVTSATGVVAKSSSVFTIPVRRVISNLMGGAIQRTMSLSGTSLTFAGGGEVKTLVDGTGAEASFTTPRSMISYGNSIFVADSGNKVIRKIEISGTDAGKVTTLAGSNVAGSSDGTGLAASFSSLGGITTDGINLYVSDSGNNKIRMISPRAGFLLDTMTANDAVVSTFAGSGSMGSKDGTGPVATFNSPNGITTDGTSLFVADGSNKIRRIDITSRAVSLLAGSGAYSSKDGIGNAASFFRPQGISFVKNDSGSFLFVSDIGSHVVRKIVVKTGSVTTFAGTGTAGAANGTGANASFRVPMDIALSSDGSFLIVADAGNNTIRQIELLSANVTTLAGSGTVGFANNADALLATFSQPNGITTVGADVFVSDTGNGLIRKISGGVVSLFAGNVSSTGTVKNIGTSATFNFPYGITSDGVNLYITESGANMIRKIEILTGKVTVLAGSSYAGSGDATGISASFNHPMGITTDGSYLYVADAASNKIRQIELSSGIVTTIAGSGAYGSNDASSNGTAASFSQPLGITTDGTYLYVADTGCNKIRRIVIATGSVSTIAGSGAVGATDNIGVLASFKNPAGITTDGTYLYVADTGNNKIRKIDILTREVTQFAGAGGDYWYNDLYDNVANGTWIGGAANFHNPTGITTDGTNLYVADADNNVIVKIEISTKAVSVLAGSNAFGSSDGTGTRASFSQPVGITTDGTNLFTTEYLNSLIRRVQ